jgi:hypothetical protein
LLRNNQISEKNKLPFYPATNILCAGGQISHVLFCIIREVLINWKKIEERSVRRLKYFIVVTLLSLMLSGCESDPGETAINYCKALESGKTDKALSSLSKDAKVALENIGGKTLLAEVGKKFNERKGIKTVKVTKKIVKNKNAAVELLFTFNDGSTFIDNFPLVKEDGKWKITK